MRKLTNDEQKAYKRSVAAADEFLRKIRELTEAERQVVHQMGEQIIADVLHFYLSESEGAAPRPECFACAAAFTTAFVNEFFKPEVKRFLPSDN